MVNEKAIDLVIHAIETSGKSYEKIAVESNISKATLSRLVTQRKASRPTLDILAAYFEVGEEYQKAVGEQSHTCEYASALCIELQETRANYDQRIAATREHYEQQIASLREQNTRQEAERNREREAQEKTYSASLAYLKEDNARLRNELAIANKAAIDLAESTKSFSGKKHVVFWVMAGINVLLALLLFVALRTGPLF